MKRISKRNVLLKGSDIKNIEENRTAKRQKYEDNSEPIKASKRSRYWNDPNATRLAKRKCPDLQRAAERTRYHGVLELPLPPKGMLQHDLLHTSIKKLRGFRICMHAIFVKH